MTINFTYSSVEKFIKMFLKTVYSVKVITLLHYKQLVWLCRVFYIKFNKVLQ